MVSSTSDIKYKSDLKTNWGNVITSFRWNHVYNPELRFPIHFSIEAYYKKLHNLADFRENAVLFQSDFDINTSIITGGEGISKGIEVLLAKDVRRITGWI